MVDAKTTSRWLPAMVAGALLTVALGLGGVTYPAGQASADAGFASTKLQSQVIQANAEGQAGQVVLLTQASAKKAKAAKKAYKSYLVKHKSYKYFRIVNISTDGTPVLLCTKQQPFTFLGPNFWIGADVFLYDKSKASKVKKLGSLSTGGTAYRLQYAKGVVYSPRLAGAHTFAVAKVKNGKLLYTGMFDDAYGPNLTWRHFSNHNPKTMGQIWESKALGKFGTQAQYRKLINKYGSRPLKMYKNSAANRAKRI